MGRKYRWLLIWREKENLSILSDCKNLTAKQTII